MEHDLLPIFPAGRCACDLRMPTARIHSAYYVFGSARNSPSRESGSSRRGKIWGTLAPSRHRRVWCPVEGGLHRHCKAAAVLGSQLASWLLLAHRIRHREHPVVFQCTLAAGPKCKKYGQPRPDSLWITQWICQTLPSVRQLEPQLAACKCRPGTTRIAAERWALAHTWPSALPPSSLPARVNPTTSRPPTFRPRALNT